MTDFATSPSPQRWRAWLPTTSRRPRLEAAVVVVAVASALILAQSFRYALNEARTTAGNLTTLLGEHTSLVMRATDAALLSMVTMLERTQPPDGALNYAH